MSLPPIRAWPPPARRLIRMARSARLASRSNVASPPTGASSAPNAASDGAARAMTLGVTGDSLARRCVSLAPAASVADSVSRACCSPTARPNSAVPSTPPSRRRVRLISACGARQVRPRWRSTTTTRASWMRTTTELSEQRARAACPIAAGRTRQLREQVGNRRCLLRRRRFAALGRLGQTAEIEAERAIGRPNQGQLWRIQRDRPRHDAPEQQFVDRQR